MQLRLPQEGLPLRVGVRARVRVRLHARLQLGAALAALVAERAVGGRELVLGLAELVEHGRHLPHVPGLEVAHDGVVPGHDLLLVVDAPLVARQLESPQLRLVLGLLVR